ncbi:hypothetical protein [Lysobacter sp. P5_B9]
MSWKSALPILLAALSFAASATDHSQIYDAISHVSCGSYDSGAYHITIDTRDDVVLIYANDLMGEPFWILESGVRESRELNVMSCEIDIGQCAASTSASLQLHRRAFGTMDGELTYEKSRGGKTTIRFRTKPQPIPGGTLCG